MYPQGVCRIRKPAFAGNGCAIFPIFQTADWKQKIRRSAADDLFRVSLVEIFTYIRFFVVLLADTDDDGAIGLVGFFCDLIPDAALVHQGFVAVYIVVVDFELLLTAHAAIVLLSKHQCLQNAGCFHTLHYFHFPQPPSGQGGDFFSER